MPGKSMSFTMHMDPPKTTAQESRWTVRHGKPRKYMGDDVKRAKACLMVHLAKCKPWEPFQGPVRLTVVWMFRNEKIDQVEYRIRRPDTDNLNKLLKDCMTECGFWKDDAQVCFETIIKTDVPDNPGINIQIEEIIENG